MKTKVLVQILIVALIGTVAAGAQENVNKQIKKEMKQVKREMRKAKKEMRKGMKDVHFGTFHFDGDMHEDEALALVEGKLRHLDDVLEDIEIDAHFDHDFDFDFESIEMPEIMELKALKELESLKELEDIHELIAIPEINKYIELSEVPRVKGASPLVYKYSGSSRETGSMLSLSKDLEDVSITKDFYFDVKEGTTSIDMMVEGTLSSGDLTISVNKPDGELFQKFQVSPLADVDWTQSLKLDEEGESFTGKWTINLAGSGATGNYNLRFKAR